MQYQLFLIIVVFGVTLSQPPIPTRYPGHAIGPTDAPILMEVFFDHLCPDSAAAWPTMQQLFGYYGNNMRFVVHIFPLPYHHNAFKAAQAGLVIQDATDDATWWKWLDSVFDNQIEFADFTTSYLTENECVNKMGLLAAELGVTNSTFFDGMQYGSDYDGNARIAWKYGTTRGVYGTPIFYVNGVFVTDQGWTYQQWRSVIDPLINGTSN